MSLKFYFENIKPKNVIVWITGKFNLFHDGHYELFKKSIEDLSHLDPKFYLGSTNQKYITNEDKQKFIDAYGLKFKVVPTGGQPKSILKYLNLSEDNSNVIFPVSTKDKNDPSKKYLWNEKWFKQYKKGMSIEPFSSGIAYRFEIPTVKTEGGEDISSSWIRKVLASDISEDEKKNKIKSVMKIADKPEIWKIIKKVEDNLNENI